MAVEDSLTGLVSARAAGLYSVLFTMQDGGLEEEDTDRRPDLTIDALAGVAALFFDRQCNQSYALGKMCSLYFRTEVIIIACAWRV